MSDIDELMDRNALEMAPRDIDRIIQLNREAREARAKGIKPVKTSGPKIDLSTLVKALVKDKKPASTPSAGIGRRGL